MARVTVEDCIEKVENRFKLVLMASKRAKDLEKGTMPSIPRDNDKSTIISLREIAEESISLEGLEKITKMEINNEIDENLLVDSIEDEEPTLLAEELNEIDEEDDDEDEELTEEDIEALKDLDLALDEDSIK